MGAAFSDLAFDLLEDQRFQGCKLMPQLGGLDQ